MTTTDTALPLAGRVALITGASSGFGAAAAEHLAAAGAKVALAARRKDRLDGLVTSIQAAGGTALAVELDVTDRAAVDAAAGAVRAELGRVDLVFNNAGVMLPAPIEEQQRGAWQQMIDLNITGLMHVIGAFTPQLVEAAEAGGAADLINTSSIGALNLYPNFAVYCATKAYVSHLSRQLRLELGPKLVRVTALEPGVGRTELADHVTDQGAIDWIQGARDTMQVLEADDIARLVTFIASQPRHVNLQEVTIMPTQQGS